MAGLTRIGDSGWDVSPSGIKYEAWAEPEGRCSFIGEPFRGCRVGPTRRRITVTPAHLDSGEVRVDREGVRVYCQDTPSRELLFEASPNLELVVRWPEWLD